MNEDKASKYHRLRRRADLTGTAMAGLVLLGLTIANGGQRLREAAGGAGDALTVVVMAIALLVILQIVEFPFAFYQGHVLEHRYGLSTQTSRHWLSDHAKGSALGLIAQSPIRA